MTDKKTQDDAAAADKDAAADRTISAADAAKKIGGTITLFKRAKNGTIVRDKETGRPVAEKVQIRAEHIASVGATHAVTVDGRKHAIA